MTMPTGKLAWGQAAVYDAIDDRSVIAAVTRNRAGLVALPVVTALSGLQLQLAGGWLGVVGCGDGTSAVVGSRLDLVVNGNAGPASGTRTDVLWCDVQPDSGTWSLSVITQAASAGRTGLLLATITVPANATLASQMTIAAAGPMLERRLVGWNQWNTVTSHTGNSWATTGNNFDSSPVLMIPGTYYRVRFIANSTWVNNFPSGLNPAEGRVGIGYRTSGQPLTSAILTRTSPIPWWQTGYSYPAMVEYIFQHAPTDVQLLRVFTAKVWMTVANGSYKPGNATGDPGPLQIMTVEDMGS
jgi:hypothetical protein